MKRQNLNSLSIFARLSTIVACVIAIAPGGLRAAEEEIIPLTAIDSYAPTALWTLVFIEYFIPEVDRRLAETGHYRIK